MDTYESTTLATLRREVERISTRCPELATRAESAAAILLGAKVAEREDGTFEVFGSVETPYTVHAEATSCTCLDYQHRGAAYRGCTFCKHTLAVLLLARLSVSPTVGRRDRIRPFRPVATRRLRRAA